MLTDDILWLVIHWRSIGLIARRSWAVDGDPGVGDRQTEHAILYRGDMLGCPGVETGRWFYLKVWKKVEAPDIISKWKNSSVIFQVSPQLKHAELQYFRT